MPVDLHRDFPFAFGNTLSDTWKDHARPFAETIIILRVFESEGQDSEIAEVGLVNPGKALYDFRTHAQIAGRKRRMLSAWSGRRARRPA